MLPNALLWSMKVARACPPMPITFSIRTCIITSMSAVPLPGLSFSAFGLAGFAVVSYWRD